MTDLGKITELSRTIEVAEEVDVLVVGGGSAGCAAAISAARAGAKTAIIERYGYFGGMSTGGQVLLIPSLSYKESVIIRGIMLELMERLSELEEGVCGPNKDLAGSSKIKDLEKWENYFDMVQYNKIVYGGYVHPDLLKIAINELIEKESIISYLHCWACQPLVENQEVKGVFFESKEGRKIILAKVVIDCTGDGDICAQSGVQFDMEIPHRNNDETGSEVLHSVGRTSSVAVVYRLDGVNYEKLNQYQKKHREEWSNHVVEMDRIAGFPMMIFPSNRNDVVWINNWLQGYNSLLVRDLTEAEFVVRRSILKVIAYMRENQIPGIEQAKLLDIAPQIGTRGSRRIHGEYSVNSVDVFGAKSFEDAIAVFPPAVDKNMPEIPTQIPLRALIAKGIRNLYVAGRCYSSDAKANSMTNLVPHCYAMGQAAGVAAAVTAMDNCDAKDVNVKKVQNILKSQDVYLPK